MGNVGNAPARPANAGSPLPLTKESEEARQWRVLNARKLLTMNRIGRLRGYLNSGTMDYEKRERLTRILATLEGRLNYINKSLARLRPYVYPY